MERGRHGDGLGATMGSHGHGRMAGKAGEFFFLNNCSLPHRLTTDFYQNKQSSCIKTAPFLPFSGGSVAFAPPSRMSRSAAVAPHVLSPIPVKSALAKLGTDLAPENSKDQLRISAPLLDDAEEQQLPVAMTDEFFMYKYKILR